MAAPAVLWDFDGTLARRDGMWRGALAEALSQVEPEREIESDRFRPGLRDGFPWHRPAQEHHELSTAEAWWAALRPMFVRAYLGAGVSAVVARLVADLGLADLVDQVVTSAATGYEKPRPEIFRIALDLCDQPDEVWMVGDNPVADVIGAEAVGVTSLLVRTPGPDGRTRPPGSG